MDRRFAVIACVLGFLAVALGAYGAHGLDKFLLARGVEGEELAKRLANFDTAARYQMQHALALLAVAWLASVRPGKAVNAAGIALLLGTVVFSGTLYVLVVTGQKWLGAVTPIGGVLLLVGWALLAVAAAKLGKTAGPDNKNS